jgi:hypothetical protein
MNRFHGLLFALIVFSGCTAGVAPTVKNINTLTPGLVQAKKAGEPMLERGLVKSIPGFMARANSYLSDMEGVVFPLVKKGYTWKCFKRLDDGDFVCDNDEYFKDDDLASTTRLVLLDKPGFVIKPWGEFRGLYFAKTGRIAEYGDNLKGILVPVEVPMPETYKHELIYDGRVDDNIKITYLEFAEDFTKPVYYQGLSFNIASLNIINVRDIMIEVLEANEREIRFIVKN